MIPKIDSPIIPGLSAAGFILKSHINEIFEDESKIPTWDESLGQLPYVISKTEGWIRFSPKRIGYDGVATGDQYFFNKGAVQLHFRPDGILKSIALRSGYSGMLFNKISVGDKLTDVLNFFDITYDSNDEVHHPVDEKTHPGIEFYAEEHSLAEAPNQIINAIFVKMT